MRDPQREARLDRMIAGVRRGTPTEPASPRRSRAADCPEPRRQDAIRQLEAETAQALALAREAHTDGGPDPIPPSGTPGHDHRSDRRSATAAKRRRELDLVIGGLRRVAKTEPVRGPEATADQSSPCAYCRESGPVAGPAEARHAGNCGWIAARRAFESLALSG